MFAPQALPRTLPAALRDVVHRKPAVRRAAIVDLGRLATASAPEDERLDAEEPKRIEVAEAALVAALSGDAEAANRAEAAVSLANAGAAGAVQALLAASRDPDPRVRQMALLGLGEVAPKEHPEVRARLRQALADVAPALRFQALWSANRLGVEEFEAWGASALGDADPEVRYLALRLLDEFWSKSLGEASPPSAPLWGRVLGALQDEAVTVRVAAALCALPRGEQAARSVVADAINRGARLPEPQDEADLLLMAGEHQIGEAVAGLRRHAWGRLGFWPGRHAWQAKVALVALGDPVARRSVARDLGRKNPDVCALAVAAVGQARWQEQRATLERLRTSGRVDPDAIEQALARLD